MSRNSHLRENGVSVSNWYMHKHDNTSDVKINGTTNGIAGVMK